MIPVDSRVALDINFLANTIANAQNQMDEAYGSKQPPSFGIVAGALFEEVPAQAAQHQVEEECVLPMWHCCCYW